MLQSLSMDQIDEQLLERAAKLHRAALLVDAHCDTTQRLMTGGFDFGVRHDDGHVDIPRLRAGGVSALFLAVWAPASGVGGAGAAAARAQLARIAETVDRHREHLVSTRTAAEVRRAKADGRIAVLTAIEGGHLIEDSLKILSEYRRTGAAYLTLTHAFHTTWADSSGVHEALAPLHGGLTAFGRDVVQKLNRLGMMVDVSHASDDTFWDVVRTSRAPIVATHSCCRAVSPHRRNLSDDMMRAIADCGGVVHITFPAGFIDPTFPEIAPAAVEKWLADGCVAKEPLTDHVTPLGLLADHFEHALRVAGPRHVGIGSDFDGTFALPAGLDDCSRIVSLTAELLRRGHGESDLANVLGENTLRVMDACQEVAEALRRDG